MCSVLRMGEGSERGKVSCKLSSVSYQIESYQALGSRKQGLAYVALCRVTLNSSLRYAHMARQ